MDEEPFEIGDLPQPDESDSTNQDLYNAPQVMHGHKPVVGQLFDSLDDVYNFYTEYVREAGFGVRIGSIIRNPVNEVIRKEYLCYKEGERKKTNGGGQKRVRGETRECCRAKLAVVRDTKSSQYKVSLFVEEHSHMLTTPKKVPLLRSHRRVSEAQRSLTQQLVLCVI